MKMIEFFIARKIVVDGGAFNHKAPYAVKRARFVDGIRARLPVIRQHRQYWRDSGGHRTAAHRTLDQNRGGLARADFVNVLIHSLAQYQILAQEL